MVYLYVIVTEDYYFLLKYRQSQFKQASFFPCTGLCEGAITVMANLYMLLQIFAWSSRELFESRLVRSMRTNVRRLNEAVCYVSSTKLTIIIKWQVWHKINKPISVSCTPTNVSVDCKMDSGGIIPRSVHRGNRLRAVYRKIFIHVIP